MLNSCINPFVFSASYQSACSYSATLKKLWKKIARKVELKLISVKVTILQVYSQYIEKSYLFATSFFFFLPALQMITSKEVKDKLFQPFVEIILFLNPSTYLFDFLCCSLFFTLDYPVEKK